MKPLKPKENETCLVLPPAGPLCWLHPELDLYRALKAGRGDDPVSGRVQAKEVLDLETTGLFGASLVDALLERLKGGVKVQEGPRGHTLSLWLRQALREGGGDVLDVASPIPPIGADQGSSDLLPLESLLGTAAAAAKDQDTVVVEWRSDGTPRFESAPLCEKQARSLPPSSRSGKERKLWLLPLRPDGGLHERMARWTERIAVDPAIYRSAGLVPYFVTEPPPSADRLEDRGPVDTRLVPSWWGILPGDVYPEAARKSFRTLFRTLYPDRMFLFLSFENFALAGIDLYLESLMGRFAQPPAAPPRKADLKKSDIRKTPGGRQPLVLGVCGTDGSGKTSHLSALEEFLTGMGLNVRKHKIYRHGVFHATVTDLCRQCALDKNLHLWRLQRMIKIFDSMKYFYAAVEPDLASSDVLLFDRYIFTHFAAGVGRYHHDPFARELLDLFPPADRIYLLDVPTPEALKRIGSREEKTVDENPYMLRRYRHALLDLGDRQGFMVLDATAPFEANQKRILEDAEKLVKVWKEGGSA